MWDFFNNFDPNPQNVWSPFCSENDVQTGPKKMCPFLRPASYVGSGRAEQEYFSLETALNPQRLHAGFHT